MYNVFNHPTINLDPFIDIKSLIAMKPIVSAFAARNMHLAKPLKLKQTNFYNSDLKGIIDYQEEFKENPQSFDNPELLQNLIDNDLFGSYIVFEKDILYGTKSLYLRYFPGSYHSKHLADACVRLPEDAQFTFFYDWLEKQNIFEQYGRVQFFINDAGAETPMHRDWPSEFLDGIEDSADQFIWITLDLRKTLYVWDETTDKTYYTQGHCNWFNSKALHGAKSSPYASYSIKVDGTFTQEFISKIKQ